MNQVYGSPINFRSTTPDHEFVDFNANIYHLNIFLIQPYLNNLI